MGDPFVICPFNKSHKIMLSRLQGHLLKCMKSHFKTEPVICPFNSQHIIGTLQIVEHCMICPSIKDVLMQTNTYENSHDIFPPLTSASDFPDQTVNSNTAQLNTKKEVDLEINQNIVSSQAPNSPFLKHPKNTNFDSYVRVSRLRVMEKSEESNCSSQGTPKPETSSEMDQTSTSNIGSNNLNSNFCDEPILLAKNNIDYDWIYRNLEALEKKQVSIAKEIQTLRQKEEEIEREKNELIEVLKSIAISMNINHHNNNSRQEHKILACDNKVNSNTGKAVDKCDEQVHNNSNFEVAAKSDNLQNTRPSMARQTSSPSTVRPSNNARGFGRGISRTYHK